ncbi:hypothetical protein [Haloferax volcanii]|uniref:hypothetical protein n=1 Tax=Haloferax volcanii TaxID=2246 RepID=UPI003854E684
MMDEEPTWSVVIRSMYRRGEDYHSYLDEDSYPSLSSKDKGTEKSEKKTKWCREIGNKQHHNIKKDTGLTDSEIESSISWLDSANLIDSMEPFDDVSLDRLPIRLNQSGFEVAHDQFMLNKQENREDQRNSQQNQINTAIGLLTLGLLFATAADTSIQVFMTEGFTQRTISFGLITEWIIVGAIAVVLQRTGLLSPQ